MDRCFGIRARTLRLFAVLWGRYVTLALFYVGHCHRGRLNHMLHPITAVTWMEVRPWRSPRDRRQDETPDGSVSGKRVISSLKTYKGLGHGAARDDVNVQVRDFLHPMFACVANHAIARAPVSRCHAQFLDHFSDRAVKVDNLAI